MRDYTNTMTATIGVESRQSATIVGRDAYMDLALLVLGTPIDHHLALRATPARVGELCIGVGSPFGIYAQSVSFGIVSGTGRSISRDGMRPLEDTIQTDAAINPGNSGGPLCDMHGEVIGVNAVSDPRGQNLNFAVPVDTVRFVVAELLVDGRVRRAALGVGVVNEPYVDGAGKPALRLRVSRVSSRPDHSRMAT